LIDTGSARPASSHRHFSRVRPRGALARAAHAPPPDPGDKAPIARTHGSTTHTALRSHRGAGPGVVASFIDTINTHGLPASTLTDNGSVYTARFTHGHNEFELLLRALGVIQKNGHPDHPQTQGKNERFHQTLKRWLTPRPRPIDLADMQTQLDTFRAIYNTQRAHRALPPRTTPAQAYTALPKATPPAINPTEHFRIRRDTADDCGKLTLRYANRVHHLGIGVAHAGTQSPHPGDRHHRQRHRPNNPPSHRQPPHRPRPQLLAQPTKTRRPMAGAICNR
jgi:hypothetical protein